MHNTLKLNLSLSTLNDKNYGSRGNWNYFLSKEPDIRRTMLQLENWDSGTSTEEIDIFGIRVKKRGHVETVKTVV